MRCPNCSHEVSDETGYCPVCASELPLGESKDVSMNETSFSMPALVLNPTPPAAKKPRETYSALDGLRLANGVWAAILLFAAAVVCLYFFLS